MTRFKLLMVAGALTALAGSPAFAEEASVAQVTRTIDAGSAANPLSAPSLFQVSAENGDATVTVRLGFQRSHETPDGFAFHTFSLGATSPADTKGKVSPVATLDGLVDNTSIELNYRRLGARGQVRDVAAAMDICREARARIEAKSQAEQDAAPKGCREQVRTFAPERYVEFDEQLFKPTGAISIFNLNAKVGTKAFDFVDAGTLAQLSDRKTSWSAAASMTWYFLSNSSLVTVTAKQQEAYEDQDEATLCPAGAGPVLKCVTAAVGAPSKVTRSLVAAEVRRGFGSYAIAATATYDVKNDVYGVEVPIYLIPGDKGALTGGLKVGWRSDTKDVTAGVFVGKAFSTLPF